MESVGEILPRVLARLAMPRPRCRCGEVAEERERRTPAGDALYYFCARCRKPVGDA